MLPVHFIVQEKKQKNVSLGIRNNKTFTVKQMDHVWNFALMEKATRRKEDIRMTGTQSKTREWSSKAKMDIY